MCTDRLSALVAVHTRRIHIVHSHRTWAAAACDSRAIIYYYYYYLLKFFFKKIPIHFHFYYFFAIFSLFNFWFFFFKYVFVVSTRFIRPVTSRTLLSKSYSNFGSFFWSNTRIDIKRRVLKWRSFVVRYFILFHRDNKCILW